MIEITLLGDFKICKDGIDIAEKLRQSPKKVLLLEYLLINRDKPVSVSTLIDVLWEGKDDANLESSLKTLVSRLRKDLLEFGLEDAILTKQKAYTWNPDLDCMIDVFRIEEIAEQLKNITDLTDESRMLFEEVMDLYEDDILANSGLSAWVAPKTYYYRNLYLKTTYQYIDLLNKVEEYNQVIRVCKVALEIDVFDSLLNIELMQALMRIGKAKDALAQYQNVTELHYIHLGIKPSDAILDFYKELMLESRNTESTIEKIHAELVEEEEKLKGAFVCDYSIFKDIYSLYMRNMKRQDTPMFLAIISLQYVGMKELNPIETDKAMKLLLDIIQQRLRSGDTIARYSLNQYVVLLPNIPTHDIAKTILKRMQSAYYTTGENSKFNYNYHVLRMGSQLP